MVAGGPVRARQAALVLSKLRGLVRQVFMHTLSAISSETTEASKCRFGDYKNAHLLDKSDPRWLHEKEVCLCAPARACACT